MGNGGEMLRADNRITPRIGRLVAPWIGRRNFHSLSQEERDETRE
jgi:hypothetical protein